ncbi:hypothetical protein TorRG33x02_218080 [Trema orientale]|uniref:Transmembrane protein n=1 Tax=Trema orientale TaxID=63057 RepID=A0A2P5EAB5_TREOI|nr:hypothetical protein TorRG33x02_218080 [Trema orientale]
MSTFLVALSTYVLAWATVTIEEAQPRATIEAQVNNSINHGGVMSKISHMSGALASVLLLLIILPVLGWVTFLLWTLCFVKTAYEFIEVVLYQLLEKMRKKEEEELPV